MCYPFNGNHRKYEILCFAYSNKHERGASKSK